MRAIVRGILARRMPEAPEEFVALQISRLNEALLVAYSAMSGQNLRAVDRVVRIVRELDRYHGFFAAERRPRRNARDAETKAEGPLSCWRVACKRRRKRLKRLNLRPEPAGPRTAWMRRLGWAWPRRRRTGARAMSRRSLARKRLRNVLKKLNPRPKMSGPRPPRRKASPPLPAWRRPRAHLMRRRSCARKRRRKRLKRLNPRPIMTGPRPPRRKASPSLPTRRRPRALLMRRRSRARKRRRKRLKKLNSRPETTWRPTRRTSPSSRPSPRRLRILPRTRRCPPGRQKFRCEMAWAPSPRARPSPSSAWRAATRTASGG